MKNTVSKTEKILNDLHKLVKQHYECFPPMKWKVISGSDQEEVLFDHGFKDLQLNRNMTLDLECMLEVPAARDGVVLDGEPLLVRISSLYPVTLTCNDKVVFHEDGVPVAAGPALINWVDKLDSSKPPRLGCKIHVPDQEPFCGVYLHCYTPSLLERFELLDVAWAQLAWCNAVAETEEEKNAVIRAANLAEELCTTTEAGKVNALCGAVSEALAFMNDNANKMNVHLIGHCHIDLCWLWRYPDTVEVIKRDMRSILSMMDDYPELTFSFSQAAAYEIMENEEPELFEKLKHYVENRRWEVTAMQWVESDVNMPSGEALVRQLQHGVNYCQTKLGVRPRVFHSPDTFGHSGNLPQLAAAAGGEYYYHHRGNPNGHDFFPAYTWQGIDGTEITGLTTICYNGEISAGGVVKAALRARKHGHGCAMVFHGIGDHGGGPSRQNLDVLRRISKASALPNMFCSRIDAYGDEITSSVKNLPVHRGESSTLFHGCYTTHADSKYYNRYSEKKLVAAETLAVMTGTACNKILDRSWKTTLFNQFHDIICGSSISDVYKDQEVDFIQVSSTADKFIETALDAESSKDDACIAVINTLGIQRNEAALLSGNEYKNIKSLESASGKIIPVQHSEKGCCFMAEVAPFSIEYYKISKQSVETSFDEEFNVCESYNPADYVWENMEIPPDEKPHYKVETPFFKTFIRRDSGIIVSLFDKRAGRELVGYGLNNSMANPSTVRSDLALNVFQVTHELPHHMSSWQLQEVDSVISLLTGGTTEIKETGPVRIVLSVTIPFQDSIIKQDIIFYRELPRIDFVANIDWQEKSSAETGTSGLNVSFNCGMDLPEAWFEIPYGAAKRFADGQESPALRWACVSNHDYCAALLNDCKYGYDIMGSRIRLTLLRNAYDPDKQSDLGKHRCSWSFVPHPGDWHSAGIHDQAAIFDQPLITKNCRNSAGTNGLQQIHIRPDSSVKITGMKPAENGNGIILRITETEGRDATEEISGIPAGAKLSVCDILEENDRETTNNTVRLRPWQVLGLRVH